MIESLECNFQGLADAFNCSLITYTTFLVVTWTDEMTSKLVTNSLKFRINFLFFLFQVVHPCRMSRIHFYPTQRK